MPRSISAENLDPAVKRVLRDMALDIKALVADAAALRASIVAITAKMDADAGITDVNYASTTNPVANTATSATITGV